MNVRIFWVRAMKCMCAQTRPRFILSSEGVFGGMEFEPMLTPRGKSPLPENVPWGGSNPWHCGQRAQALPTELFRPPLHQVKNWKMQGCFMLLWPPGPHLSADFSILNSHAWLWQSLGHGCSQCTSDLQICHSVSDLLDACCHGFSATTVCPCVRILCLT